MFAYGSCLTRLVREFIVFHHFGPRRVFVAVPGGVGAISLAIEKFLNLLDLADHVALTYM